MNLNKIHAVKVSFFLHFTPVYPHYEIEISIIPY